MSEQQSEQKCKACGKTLVICPHCQGDDDYVDAGCAQGGYYLCDDEDCAEYEFCCGC